MRGVQNGGEKNKGQRNISHEHYSIWWMEIKDDGSYQFFLNPKHLYIYLTVYHYVTVSLSPCVCISCCYNQLRLASAALFTRPVNSGETKNDLRGAGGRETLLVFIGEEKPKQQMDRVVSLTQISTPLILSFIGERPHRMPDPTRRKTTRIRTSRSSGHERG